MTQAPCKNCADRDMSCHGLCKDYNEWVSKHRHEVEMERLTKPWVIHYTDFNYTSAKPRKR